LSGDPFLPRQPIPRSIAAQHALPEGGRRFTGLSPISVEPAVNCILVKDFLMSDSLEALIEAAWESRGPGGMLQGSGRSSDSGQASIVRPTILPAATVAPQPGSGRIARIGELMPAR
jgi:hypothetical protein